MIFDTAIKYNRKNDFPVFLLILLVLSLFMVCWFGPVSEYSGHDYYFNIGRIEVLMQALKDGTYPIYLDHDTLNGYGYFTKGFYPDLVILPFAAIGLLIGSVPAYNILIFVMTFLCGLFMYKAVFTVFQNSFVASASAILYTFSAYHLFDWYNRAALGESISFTFLPIIFIGLYHIIKGDYKKWYLITIGYSLLIYTHLLSSFLTFIVIALILILNCKQLIKEPKRIGYLVLAAVITIPIVGSYIFPMLEQMASNTFYYNSNENITGQTKLGIEELAWGMLSGVLYPKDKNMAGVGPLLVIIMLLRFFVKEKTASLRFADFCLSIGLIFYFMASALFPWGRLPLGFIQFPWRLYEFIIFFLSVSGAYYVFAVLKSRKYYVVAMGILVIYTLMVMVINNGNYKYWQTRTKEAAPEWFTGVPSTANQYFKGGLEYLPSRVPDYGFMERRGYKAIAGKENTQIENISKNKGVTNLNFSVSESDVIELPLIYYKGYKAELNSQEVPIEQSPDGLIQVSVSESGHLEVYYTETMMQKISWYVTLLSIIFLCIYLFKRRESL